MIPFIAAAAMYVLAPKTRTARQGRPQGRPVGAPPAPEPNRALMQSEGIRRTGGANSWSKFQVYQDPASGLYYAFRAGAASVYGISVSGRKMIWSGTTWLDTIPAGAMPGRPTNRDPYPSPSETQAIRLKNLMRKGVI